MTILTKLGIFEQNYQKTVRMILINKWWKRLLISVIIGGILSEAIGLLTERKIELNAFLIGIVLYLILRILYGVIQREKIKQ